MSFSRDTGGNLSAAPNFHGDPRPSVSLNPETTYFVVMRVDVNSQVTVWLNPVLGKTEAEVDEGRFLQRWTFNWPLDGSSNPISLPYAQLYMRRAADTTESDFDEFRLAQVGGDFTAAQAWMAVTPIAPQVIASISNDDGNSPPWIGDTLRGNYTFYSTIAVGASAYRWLRADTAEGEYTAIDGATSNTYTLTSADRGKYLKFEVTVVDANNAEYPTVLTAPTEKIPEHPSVSNVAIDGVPRVGRILRGSYAYSGDLIEGASSFRWLRADSAEGQYAAISGATGISYTLTGDDAGKYIKFESTPIDISGSAGSALSSSPTSAVAAPILVYDPFPIGADPDTAGYYNADQDVYSFHNASIGTTGLWGGQGNWAGSWNDNNRRTVVNGTLSYSSNGYALIASGGKLEPAAENTTLLRRFSANGIASGTYYVSFLETAPTSGSWQYYGLWLSSGGSDSNRLIINFNGGATPYARPQFHSTWGTGSQEVTAGETYFVVMRIDAGSQVTIWLNPGLGKTEAEVENDDDYLNRWTFDWPLDGGNPKSLPYAHLYMRRYSSTEESEFDEFRLDKVGDGITAADAWAAVTPCVPLWTTGPVADAPIQIGTWNPLNVNVQLPPWVFPMVYHMDTSTPMPTAEYAQKFIDTVGSFPADRPVWLQSHNWLGRYKPNWHPHNVMSHIDDAVVEGVPPNEVKTPGIWPDEGKEIWLAKQKEFLAILKAHGIRLDMWPLDHETWVNEWAHCWAANYAFRNIVNDPRWATEPLPGMDGLKGIDLLHPDELSDEDPFTRNFSIGGQIVPITDIRRALDASVVIAYAMPTIVKNEVFAAPTLEAYPHAVVSDYGRSSHRRPIPPLDPWSYMPGTQEGFWDDVMDEKPGLTEIPGVGNAAAPSLYWGSSFRNRDPEDPGRVAGMLYTIDKVIERYDNDPTKVTPWMTLPNYAPDNDTRLTVEEYQQLWIGLAERGIRQYILWFNPADQNTEEAVKEFRTAIQKANKAAQEYQAQQQQ